MNIIHSRREVMQLRIRLLAFLQLPLQSPDTPATRIYPTKTLHLYRGSTTRVIRAEGEAGGAVRLGWAPAGSRGDGGRRGRLVHAGKLCVLLLLLLMLLGASGEVSVLIGEGAYDVGDFGWKIVLWSWPTIDAEFLLWFIRPSKHLSGVRISDLRLYHLI